jgi:hypothetical protein
MYLALLKLGTATYHVTRGRDLGLVYIFEQFMIFSQIYQIFNFHIEQNSFFLLEQITDY